MPVSGQSTRFALRLTGVTISALAPHHRRGAACLAGWMPRDRQGALCGAVRALLDRVLADTDTATTSNQYIALRVLAVRGPAPSPAALHEFLAGQRQLGLDLPAVAALFAGLEARGLVSGSAPDGPGPTQLTAEGAALYARLADAVTTVTTQLYAGFDPDDLATAHRVLAQVVERAGRLRGEH